MKTILSLALGSFLLAGHPLGAQTYTFHTVTATNTSVDGALDGMVVADHLASNNYGSSIGQMGLIFADQTPVAGVVGTPTGTFRGDADGSLANELGLIAYCADSESPFNGTGGQATVALTAYTIAQAEARYLGEVTYYLPGALKRAAYLLETFGQAAHAGGNVQAAAMQAAIWESLYDATTSVTEGNGSYYLRTSAGTSTAQASAVQARDQANTWLNQAAAAEWGGSGYDPASRVMVWMHPTDASAFQSVISLAAPQLQIQPIPEPASAALLLAGGLLVLRRRRN